MFLFFNGILMYLFVLFKFDFMGLDVVCDELLFLELQNRSMLSILVEILDLIINYVKDKEVILILIFLIKDLVGIQGNEVNQNNWVILFFNEGIGILFIEVVFLFSCLGDIKFMLEKFKLIVIDEYQSKDVEEILFRREKEVMLSIIFNDFDLC